MFALKGLSAGPKSAEMTAFPYCVRQGLKLRFADGQRWVIYPVDEEAAAIVAGLGRVMCLGTASWSVTPAEVGRELCVAVCDESERSDLERTGAVVCRLAAPTDRETEVVQMRLLASMIAREALARGGLLLHGALVEHQGRGFIMAGSGGIGKTTASRRLPSPWRSLCDDMTLVVRDDKGQYWAHPWPTWSRFADDGPGGFWTVENAVPLRAIFFLDRSPSDLLEQVGVTQATALILASEVELVREVRFVLSDVKDARTLTGEALHGARALALAVPAYLLRLSLTGRFWEEIERVLPAGALPGSGDDNRGRDPVSVESLVPRGSLRLVCTGPSMRPTLREPEFLEVKPYGTGRVRTGDVVGFKSPETGKTVVHRVVSIDPQSRIRTRGDNNLKDDPWDLQPGDIIGRVKSAQRGTRRRAIPGGWRGLVAFRLARLRRRIRRGAGRLFHKLYRFLAGLGLFEHLLPRSLRPRPVLFDTRHRAFLILLMGRRTVGRYDRSLQKWHIQRPFRLFVDERTLGRVGVSLFSSSEVRH